MQQFNLHCCTLVMDGTDHITSVGVDSTASKKSHEHPLVANAARSDCDLFCPFILFALLRTASHLVLSMGRRCVNIANCQSLSIYHGGTTCSISDHRVYPF